MFSMLSGHTSLPLPSLRSLRCFRWGVRLLDELASGFLELSPLGENDMGRNSAGDWSGKRKREGVIRTRMAYIDMRKWLHSGTIS
jgi:hypothetical protein